MRNVQNKIDHFCFRAHVQFVHSQASMKNAVYVVIFCSLLVLFFLVLTGMY